MLFPGDGKKGNSFSPRHIRGEDTCVAQSAVWGKCRAWCGPVPCTQDVLLEVGEAFIV